MRYISALISDARGKIGGQVYSRNPYGPYVRARTAPLQPRTPSQQAGRAQFATISAAWRALTALERTGWNTYAAQTVQRDSLGRKSVPSGFQAYTTCSRYAGLVGSPFSPTPPSGPEETTQLFIGGSAENTGVSPFLVLLLNFSGYVSPPVGALILQATAGLSPTINFVPRQTYRNFPPAYNSTLFGSDFAPGYLSVFPPPAVGSVVWIRARFINRPSGISGPVTQLRFVVF